MEVNPQSIGAISTVLLALFAAVQLGLEMSRRRDRRRSARIEAHGPAWLARRSLEAALSNAKITASYFHWARLAGDKEPLDRMEAQMLAMLRLASEAGGKAAVAGQAAFNAFLAFADRINTLCTMSLSGLDRAGSMVATSDDDQRAHVLFTEALSHARRAIAELESMAPREDHEEPVIQDAEIELLSSLEP